MKHVLITGASRGLGRALALGFHAEGWAVSACATDAEAIESLAHELGPASLALTCDVTRPAEVESFASRVLERFGAPDLLLNNAALVNRNAPLWEVPPEEFSRVIDVNLKGVHLVIRAFLPAMIRRGTGVVVNFSSGWGRAASAEVAPYCATKWGIEGLTAALAAELPKGLNAALAAELPKGLTAVALNPGIIDTRMLRTSFGDAAGDYPDPECWAKVAVPFLASLGPQHNGRPLTVPQP